MLLHIIFLTNLLYTIIAIAILSIPKTSKVSATYCLPQPTLTRKNKSQISCQIVGKITAGSTNPFFLLKHIYWRYVSGRSLPINNSCLILFTTISLLQYYKFIIYLWQCLKWNKLSRNWINHREINQEFLRYFNK